jgi:hypothetical protein
MAASARDDPSTAIRALGALGVGGGVLFLAAFVVEIPAGWNPARLVLWNAGAITVAAATYGRHATRSTPLALVATVPVIVAGSAAVLWTLLAVGRDSPFSGDFGLLGFWTNLAAALSVATFGLVAWSLGLVWRWAALALAIGSLLGITGIDRLGLTSRADPTIFTPLALTGLALAGLGWVLLGIGIIVGRPQGSRRVGRNGGSRP